ncbi:MAG: hypothetical protein NUV94_07560 [Candidatus Acetothermia bacterium]|nr:hypothetical protein [Candidatus Acetothermia bacterium]
MDDEAVEVLGDGVEVPIEGERVQQHWDEVLFVKDLGLRDVLIQGCKGPGLGPLPRPVHVEIEDVGGGTGGQRPHGECEVIIGDRLPDDLYPRDLAGHESGEHVLHQRCIDGVPSESDDHLFLGEPDRTNQHHQKY